MEFNLGRLKPPNWKRPYLMWLHVSLKIVPIIISNFGAPGYKYIEGGEGYIIDNIHAEFNASVTVLMLLVDFFVTKNIIGPKLTGLHHGLKMDEERKITYHFYAEKDFLSRYPITDRDSFFTFLVVFSVIWIFPVIGTTVSLKIFWIPFMVLGFCSVYLNLYLFVQTRYYQQWTMRKFFAAWLYNFYMRIEYLDEDCGSNFRNTYQNRARY